MIQSNRARTCQMQWIQTRSTAWIKQNTQHPGIHGYCSIIAPSSTAGNHSFLDLLEAVLFDGTIVQWAQLALVGACLRGRACCCPSVYNVLPCWALAHCLKQHTIRTSAILAAVAIVILLRTCSTQAMAVPQAGLCAVLIGGIEADKQHLFYRQ
jgi:hypothetical protein